MGAWSVIFGHIGVAAMVRATLRKPGGTLALIALCLASVTPDFVDVGYALLGICSPYGLYSHTIPALAIEAAVVGGIALLVTDSIGIALGFAVVVPLHLAADYFTMHKLVMPGGDIHGLDFFSRPMLDFLAEVPIIVVGWWILRRSGRGPAWGVTWTTLLLVLALQGGIDVVAASTGRVLKPSSCPVVNGAALKDI